MARGLREAGQGERRVSTLFLLRHAKAGWAAPGMRDFDRPLDGTGMGDAAAMGEVMRSRAYVPDITLCSNAARARQTLEGVAGSADTGRVVFLDKLYTEDATGYLELIQENGGYGSILLIGHNPMIEDLAMAIAASGDPDALSMLALGFPTSGLAVIHFENGLARLEPGKGYLEAFHTPADA